LVRRRRRLAIDNSEKENKYINSLKNQALQRSGSSIRTPYDSTRSVNQLFLAEAEPNKPTKLQHRDSQENLLKESFSNTSVRNSLILEDIPESPIRQP